LSLLWKGIARRKDNDARVHRIRRGGEREKGGYTTQAR